MGPGGELALCYMTAASGEAIATSSGSVGVTPSDLSRKPTTTGCEDDPPTGGFAVIQLLNVSHSLPPYGL